MGPWKILTWAGLAYLLPTSGLQLVLEEAGIHKTAMCSDRRASARDLCNQGRLSFIHRHYTAPGVELSFVVAGRSPQAQIYHVVIPATENPG